MSTTGTPTSAEAQSDAEIIVKVEDQIAWLCFNRPERLNAFDPDQFKLLTDLMDEMSTRKDVGVVVLTGIGRAFSAGGDVREFTKDGLVETGIYAFRALTAIRRCRKPVIAMVNGLAVGGGNELVIAADIAIAARSARLGQAGNDDRRLSGDRRDQLVAAADRREAG